MDSNIKIYIDTNVIFNYCVGEQKDTVIFNFLTRIRHKKNLFVSSLSLIQVVSILQSRNKKNFPEDRKRAAINNLRNVVKKVSIARLEEKDVLLALGYDDSEYDLEDVVHYCIYKKLNCNALVTHNVSDFGKFNHINIIPAHLGIIKNEID